MLGFGALGQYALGQVSSPVQGSTTLAGVSATAAVGTLTTPASPNVALVGVGSTAAVGTLTITVSVSTALTGVAGTAAAGTLTITAMASPTLTGVAGAAGAGGMGTSATDTVTVVLVGVSATTSAGTLGTAFDSRGLPTGVAGTAAAGTIAITASGTASPSGVTGTTGVGTLKGGPSGIATGVAGTASVGTLTVTISIGSVRRLTLRNALRRLRLLGNWAGTRSRNMYVGRDFDPANPTETEIYSLDFVNELADLETLSSISAVTLTVFQGTDATPSSHLSGSASISGTTVSQRLATLTSGVTYTLAITVITSLSNTITLFSRVACRPVQ